MLIPASGDHLLQTVYSLDIQPGKFMPLVGIDPYSGALFSYIIAICMRVFGIRLETPFVVMLITGAMTVGLTCLLARALGLSRPWAILAGLLMAANPHHILINSHPPGTSYIIPLFTTAFLLAMALAIRRESGLWLVAAGALLGLAMQTNLISALMVPGVVVWFLLQKKSAIGLRTRWPYLAAAAWVLAFAPVILYNAQNSLNLVRWVKTRDYLFQFDPTPMTFVRNLERLVLQLCRQVSGVLEGHEDVQSLAGLPMLLSAWAIAGLAYTAQSKIPSGPSKLSETRGHSLSLPALAVASQVLIMPWWSAHYGMIIEPRLTTQLTPLIFVAMSALAAGAWAFVRTQVRRPDLLPAAAWSLGVLLVAISLWPLIPLFQYYQHRVAAGETNSLLYASLEEFKQRWRGESVLISGNSTLVEASQYFFTIGHIPYQVMSLERISEQLASGQEHGRVTLLLDDDDVSRIRLRANLSPWRSPVMDTIHRKLRTDWYTIEDASHIKPTFVYEPGIPAPKMRALQVSFADQLALIGYQVRSDKVAPGDTLLIDTFWQATRAVPSALTGFIHLIGPNGRLAAQADQEFGRGFYPTNYWQLGDVVREKHELVLSGDLAPGDYSIWAGVYEFPSLERLDIRSSDAPNRDNMVTLGTVHVGP